MAAERGRKSSSCRRLRRRSVRCQCDRSTPETLVAGAGVRGHGTHRRSPPRLPQFKARLRRLRLAVVLERPLQLQRKRLLVRGQASDFRSRDARRRVVE